MLVITTELAEESQEIVKTFAAAHRVKLGVFVADTHFCAADGLADELKKLAPKDIDSLTKAPTADQN